MMDSVSPKARFASPAANVLTVVLLTALIAAAYGFGVYLFAQLIPEMRRDFGFGYGFVGAVTAAGQLSFLAASLLTPLVVRRIGDTMVVLGSGLVCALCLLGISVVRDAWLLAALLIILAGMSSSIWVPMIGIIGRRVAPAHRGIALGLASAGTSYGVFINSLLVPIFAPGGNWRAVWLILGATTLALVLISAVVFLRSGLFARTGTRNRGQREARHGERGVVSWVVVVWLTMFLLGLSNGPFQNYLSSYVRDELHYGVDFASRIWSAVGIVGMFAGLAVGWLSDRIGLRFTMLLVYLCILLAAAVFALGMSGPFLVMAGVLFALAFYPIFGLVPAYVSKLAADEDQAIMIFGVGNMCVGAGGMIGNYAAGLTAEVLGTFVWVYAGIGLCALALMVLLSRLPRLPGN